MTILGEHLRGHPCDTCDLSADSCVNTFLESSAFDLPFLVDAIANRKSIHIAPQPSSTTLAAADQAFDSLLRELWQSHVKALGALGASKGWGGSYWRAWYNSVLLDDPNAVGGAPGRVPIEALEFSNKPSDSCSSDVILQQAPEPIASELVACDGSGTVSTRGTDMRVAGLAVPFDEERGTVDTPTVASQHDDDGGGPSHRAMLKRQDEIAPANFTK